MTTFEVWGPLEASAAQEGREPSQKPNYSRFLTLMSFLVFLREEVDTAIYEFGIGGAWDSTNILDVAHTAESLKVAGRWFAEEIGKRYCLTLRLF